MVHSATASAVASTTAFMLLGRTAAATSSASGMFGVSVIDILIMQILINIKLFEA
jgi:hypothetical protein